VRRVLGDRRERGVGVVGPVGAQEPDVEVDPDEAAALADRAQLVVGEVARRRAEHVRAGVRGDERRSARRRHVPEPARVEVREVDQDSQLGARAHERPPRVGQPRPLVRRAGEPERHAGRVRVRPAPHQTERAHPGGVQHLELVERRPDRLGPFDVQDRGEPACASRRSRVSIAACASRRSRVSIAREEAGRGVGTGLGEPRERVVVAVEDARHARKRGRERRAMTRRRPSGLTS
jgi:hypothetical protein